MQEINKKKIGLILGSFTGLMHLVWALLVAIGLAQPLMDWIFGLHMISPVYQVLPFNLGSSIILIIATFLGGYIFGWIFAAVWNYHGKKK